MSWKHQKSWFKETFMAGRSNEEDNINMKSLSHDGRKWVRAAAVICGLCLRSVCVLSFKPPPNFQGILKDCWKWNLTLQTLHFAKKIKFFRKFDTCVAKLSVKFQELCDEWIHT